MATARVRAERGTPKRVELRQAVIFIKFLEGEVEATKQITLRRCIANTLCYAITFLTYLPPLHKDRQIRGHKERERSIAARYTPAVSRENPPATAAWPVRIPINRDSLSAPTNVGARKTQKLPPPPHKHQCCVRKCVASKAKCYIYPMNRSRAPAPCSQKGTAFRQQS